MELHKISKNHQARLHQKQNKKTNLHVKIGVNAGNTKFGTMLTWEEKEGIEVELVNSHLHATTKR